MKKIYTILANNLQKVRRLNKLSIKQLAKKANISISTLQSIESGTTNPLLETLCKIAKALKTTPSVLCRGF